VRYVLFALVFVLAGGLGRADSQDVAGSHDYPGFPRMTGFVITDFDEDNPAAFDFPVARPLPTDSAHVETVHVSGHRYVIRYELGPSFTAQPLFQAQDYYGRIAAAAGFTMMKSGAQGNVTETFRRRGAGRETWAYLEPGMTVNVLTVVEGSGVTPETAEAPVEDSLYPSLIKNGSVILPLTFLPSKPDVDADAGPLISRVVQMLKAHPEVRLSVEGHTDDTGDATENQRLSEERARTVRALLIAGGVDGTRLAAEGMGGADPIASNNTAVGRQQNRRIELVLMK
jgi:OmpA-OmpF porin, OOP family